MWQRREACTAMDKSVDAVKRWGGKHTLPQYTEEKGEGSVLHPWSTCAGAELNWAKLPNCGLCPSLNASCFVFGMA